MKSVTINVELHNGASKREAIEAGVSLAKKLDCFISFDWNDQFRVTCCPSDDIEEKTKDFEQCSLRAGVPGEMIIPMRLVKP